MALAWECRLLRPPRSSGTFTSRAVAAKQRFGHDYNRNFIVDGNRIFWVCRVVTLGRLSGASVTALANDRKKNLPPFRILELSKIRPGSQPFVTSVSTGCQLFPTLAKQLSFRARVDVSVTLP